MSSCWTTHRKKLFGHGHEICGSGFSATLRNNRERSIPLGPDSFTELVFGLLVSSTIRSCHYANAPSWPNLILAFLENVRY